MGYYTKTNSEVDMKRYKRLVAIFMAMAVIFTSFPALVGNLEAHATSAKKPVKVTGLKKQAVGKNYITVQWTKIKKNKNTKGYAVYLNGKLYKRVGVKTNKYKISGLKSNTSYKVRIRAYNTYKQKQYYNSKTKKWQTKKPAKKNWKGKKTRNVKKYLHGPLSTTLTVKTKKTSTIADKDAVFTNARLVGAKNVDLYTDSYVDYTIKSSGKVKWSVDNSAVATISSTFESTKKTTRTCSLKFIKEGTVKLTVKSLLSGKKKNITVKAEDSMNRAPHLDLRSSSSGPDYLIAGIDNTEYSSGKTIGTISFISKNTEDKLTKTFNLVAENVTPRAYRTTLEDLGCSDAIKTNTVVSSSEISYVGGRSVLKIRVQSGPAVTAIKIYDKNGNNIGKNAEGKGIKTVYYFPKRDESYDEVLYNNVRKKVEAALWTDDMTIEQKLQAVAQYIRDTTHYPGCGTNESNKNYWENFAVEGKTTSYSSESKLGSIMKLRGGVCDCWSVSVIADFAEDLGLKYKGMYKKKQRIAAGECYIGMGREASLNSASDTHTTFWFITSQGYESYCETEGRKHSDCKDHDYRCVNGLISLK